MPHQGQLFLTIVATLVAAVCFDRVMAGSKDTGPTTKQGKANTADLPLDRVHVTGEALGRARVGQMSCFRIQALDTAGKVFDKQGQQRAFFTGFVEDTKQEIVQGLDISFDGQASHKACYYLEDPGKFDLRLFLDFNNTHQLTDRLDERFAAGYQWHKVVHSGVVTVLPEADRKYSPRRSVRAISGDPKPKAKPPCTLEQLARTGNRGYWKGLRWVPLHCSHRSIEREELMQCLNGKSLGFIGDSEMRYTLGTLKYLLASDSFDQFFKKWSRVPRDSHPVPAKGVFGNPRVDPVTLQPPKGGGKPVPRAWHKHQRDSTSFFEYFGTFREGYGFLNVQHRGPKNRWFKFNVTYIAQQGASHDVTVPWMHDKTVTEGSTALQHAPFDHVLMNLNLHEMLNFNNSRDYAQNLTSKYIPLLKRVVRRPSDVSFVGMWAAQATMKNMKFMHISNNPRGYSFEDAAMKVLPGLGFKNIFLTRHMTQPREDLCLDSTHYSWPVTYAMLDLYFSALCNSGKSSSNQ